jgi:hypothetical protein
VISCDCVRLPTGASGGQPPPCQANHFIAVIPYAFTMFNFDGTICYAQRRQSQPFGMNLEPVLLPVGTHQAALIAGGLRGRIRHWRRS